MKSIIVPTDFSPAADNAMLFAGELAQSINASILLLHVYQIPVSMNDVPVLMVSAEELKLSADAGLERTKQALKKNYSGIEIKTESRLGDIVDELNDVCKEVSPFAIVVGKHWASGIERFLFGSTSLSIIRHTNIPVIAVPDTTKKYQLKNIALAIDESGPGRQKQMIEQFIKELNASLHIIHIQTDSRESEKAEKLAAGLNATFHTIHDHEFMHGIQTFTQSNKIDLIIILPHKHSLIERLFLKTHTVELVQKLPIPIMCLPE